MKIVLCTNNALASRMLRAVMWSRWSHSAIYDDEQGYVYDSTFSGGVRVTPYYKWASKYPRMEHRPIVVRDVYEARKWLGEQLGKPYDLGAIFALPLKRNWQEDDSWFCSELSETFRSKFSTPVFRAAANRITPHHQDIVCDTKD